MTQFFNTGLTQQQFLDEYWQKKPLLIRQAFADFESPITPDDLAGLACEPDIESRLIEEHGPEGPWQVTHGPLADEDFARLPATHWTMLVQDVDKHLPELQYVLDPFRFIPDWRRDDLMISYAPKYGSVGAHTDGYDVFLLQAIGIRKWQISDKPLHDVELIAGLSVQIMADFDAANEWNLKPGDMLYLPPHYAHHGVAQDDCMTFSIGFRAPSQTDLLDAVINSLLENGVAKGRYADADLQVPKHHSEIDSQAVGRLKALLHDTIEQAEPLLAHALGKYVSETKLSLVSLAEQSMTDLPTIEEVNSLFAAGEVLTQSLYHRFAWSKQGEVATLYLAGEAYELEGDSSNLLELLAESEQLNCEDWLQIKSNPLAADLLCQLIAEGGWYWVSAEG
jgi:50S ribosomal protein L16 3-hydroxylase